MGDGVLDDRIATGLVADQVNATLGGEEFTAFANGTSNSFDTFSASSTGFTAGADGSGAGAIVTNQLWTAEGGNVAVEDFERMNGQINGEGTETSDDVPAMLSDGEFVMTGQAVRGAGSYNMNNESGIITPSPTGAPSRDGGTDLMYQLMEAFSSQARPA